MSGLVPFLHTSTSMNIEPPHFIILYDGVCGLCNRFVRLVLRFDKRGVFRFASLQSPFAAAVLQRHGINPLQLDTVYLVLDYGSAGEQLLARDHAVVAILKQLGGAWKFWASISKLLPKLFRQWLYNLIARNRYRIFGKYESCPLPDEKIRSKLLD